MKTCLRVAASAFAGLGVAIWLATTPGAADATVSGVVALATGLSVSALVWRGIGYTLRGVR